MSLKVLISGGNVTKARNGRYHPSEYWDESRYEEGRLSQKLFLVWRPDYPAEGNWHQRHHVVYWLHTGIVPDWKNKREMIHHNNHDHADDRFENLQFMTVAEHSSHHNSKIPLTLICAHCNKEFQKPKWKDYQKFCSLTCFQAYPKSEETRRKHSIAAKGRISSIKGRALSEEHKIAIGVGVRRHYSGVK